MKCKPSFFIWCAIFVFLLVLSGCDNGDGALTEVNLAVGYIPNVQFAPFYVAIENGYYDEEGLSVDLVYGYEIDGVSLVGAGEYQFAVASGEQVLMARDKALPVVYVMNWYEKFPVGITVLSEMNISALIDLENHSIGTPALQGASYIALQALLNQAGLTMEDVDVEVIGYSQVEMLSTRKVDAVVVYLANEPVQLEAQGYETKSFAVSDYIDLVGNGLVTNEQTIEQNPELISKMVRATLRGMQFAAENPDEAYRICRNYVDNLPDREENDQQYEVLLRSIDFWSMNQTGLTSSSAWANTDSLLRQMGLVTNPADEDETFTNIFLPPAQ